MSGVSTKIHHSCFAKTCKGVIKGISKEEQLQITLQTPNRKLFWCPNANGGWLLEKCKCAI